MMQTKHTPGPWFLINDACVGGPVESGWEQAGCGIAHCGMRARTSEEAAANARLIAAAPEMYEALKALLACPDISDVAGEDKDPETHAAESIARAALSKARGEA